MAQPETGLQTACQALLRESLPKLEVTKFHGNEFTRSGEPDLFGCYCGRMFAVEIKMPGNTATAIQRSRLRAWARSGAIVGIARTPDECLRIVRDQEPIGHDEIWK